MSLDNMRNSVQRQKRRIHLGTEATKVGLIDGRIPPSIQWKYHTIQNIAASIRGVLPDSVQRRLFFAGNRIDTNSHAYTLTAAQYHIPHHVLTGDGMTRNVFLLVPRRENLNPSIVKFFPSPSRSRAAAGAVLRTIKQSHEQYKGFFPDIPTCVLPEKSRIICMRKNGKVDIVSEQPFVHILTDLRIETDEEQLEIELALTKMSTDAQKNFIAFVEDLESLYERGICIDLLGKNNVVCIDGDTSNPIRILDTYGVFCLQESEEKWRDILHHDTRVIHTHSHDVRIRRYRSILHRLQSVKQTLSVIQPSLQPQVHPQSQ